MDYKELFGNELEEQKVETISEQEPASETFSVSEKTDEPENEKNVNAVMPDEKINKSTNKIAVVIMTILFLVVIGLSAYIGIKISRMGVSEKKDTEYQTESQNPWEDLLETPKSENDSESDGQRDSEMQNDSDVQGDADIELDWDFFRDPNKEPNGEDIEYEDEIGWFDEQYPNYAPEDITGPYYESMVDCINMDVPYTVQRQYYGYKEKRDIIEINASYIQLQGEIPQLEEINKRLKEGALTYARDYKAKKQQFDDALEDNNITIYVDVVSNVTYNSENIISVVINEQVVYGAITHSVVLRSYNINTETGTILDNTEILKLNEEFAKEFRNRSLKQNGRISGGVDAFTDAEIAGMLNDSSSLVLFYTPLGMEVGYMYESDNGSGWVTITLQDYEKYLLFS